MAQPLLLLFGDVRLYIANKQQPITFSFRTCWCFKYSDRRGQSSRDKSVCQGSDG